MTIVVERKAITPYALYWRSRRRAPVDKWSVVEWDDISRYLIVPTRGGGVIVSSFELPKPVVVPIGGKFTQVGVDERLTISVRRA